MKSIQIDLQEAIEISRRGDVGETYQAVNFEYYCERNETSNHMLANLASEHRFFLCVQILNANAANLTDSDLGYVLDILTTAPLSKHLLQSAQAKAYCQDMLERFHNDVIISKDDQGWKDKLYTGYTI